jgi:hypothetical protein
MTITGPAVAGRASGTGALEALTLAPGLAIVNGALTVTGGGGGGGYPSLVMPTGFDVSGSGTASIGVAFASGYRLLTTAEATTWNQAATAVAGKAAAGAIGASGLTMTGPGVAGRSSGTGAIETLTLSGLSIQAGVLTADPATQVRKLARNQTGATIAKGAAVYLSGASGSKLLISLADASSEATASQTLGLAMEAIADNADGWVLSLGPLEGVNTAALAEGQIVWLSETPGQLTTTRPTQPAHGVVLGYCVRQGGGTSGSVYVRVVNGQELGELHDVLLTGAVTDQALMLAADGLWKPRTLTAALVGADVSGAAAAAVGAHRLEIDPHGGYALGGAIASSRLTMTGPGIVGRASGTGALQTLTLGPNLSIVGGVLTVTAGGAGTVTSVGLSLPAIFTVSNSPVESAGTLTAVLATQTAGLVFAGPASGAAAAPTFRQLGYGELSGLPTLGGAAALNVGTTAGTVAAGDDGRLSDAREWSAATVTQAEAEAGTGTARLAFTPQRVFQAAAAWWQGATTAAGRALATAVDAAAQRTVMGAAATGPIGSSGLTMATARLLGRTTAGTGATEEITVGSGLTLTGATLAATATAGGTKTLQRFTPRDNQPPAASFATLDTRNSVAVLEFDAATQESAVFLGVISEGANLTSGLMVRLWWMGDTATSGNVRWGAAFERTGTDLDADSFDTTTEVTSAASSTSGIEVVAEITCTAIDSLAAGDRFRLRIQRVATDATNDTMTGDAQLTAVEVRGVA